MQMACFIDFTKAFDFVNRTKLWHILRSSGFSTRFMISTKSIYNCVKSCVKFNDNISACFDCPLSLPQGCILSPLLFSIMLNDLAYEIELCWQEFNFIPSIYNYSFFYLLMMLYLFRIQFLVCKNDLMCWNNFVQITV